MTRDELIDELDDRGGDCPVVVQDLDNGRIYTIKAVRFEYDEESTGPTFFLEAEES